MEDLITFEADGITIEGLFVQNSDSKAVIITHPHSLYGGDMHNSVVYLIHKAYSEKGFSTLRFNFRGVGNSSGTFDDGIGEQNDLKAACDFLSAKGFQAIDLAGYSFGSWVGASLACQNDLFNRVVLVSPPVSFMDFSSISQIPSLTLTVVGDQDDFADLGQLKERMALLNAEAHLKILPNTDHFYSGNLEELKTILQAGIE